MPTFLRGAQRGMFNTYHAFFCGSKYKTASSVRTVSRSAFCSRASQKSFNALRKLVHLHEIVAGDARWVLRPEPARWIIAVHVGGCALGEDHLRGRERFAVAR